MLFFYVRHGDPIYSPDSLTPLGERQAEAVGKRLAYFGMDKIFASSSTRAKLTAKPLCEMTKKEATILDFANENHAWNEFTIENERKTWLFHDGTARKLMTSAEILSLGEEWYKHPEFEKYHYEKGLERIRNESDAFFASLGYEHIRGRGIYLPKEPNNDRVALFAHQGFGIAFLSCLLDIPYPLFCMHFDLSHSSVTVIDFKNEGDMAVPRICTLSNDAHLYREGLPTTYNGQFRF